MNQITLYARVSYSDLCAGVAVRLAQRLCFLCSLCELLSVFMGPANFHAARPGASPNRQAELRCRLYANFSVMALKRALTRFRLFPIVRGVESEQPEQRRTDRANTYQAQARHPNLSPTGAASSSSPRAGDRPVTRATVGTAMESSQVRTPGRLPQKNFPIFPYSNFFLSMQSSL